MGRTLLNKVITVLFPTGKKRYVIFIPKKPDVFKLIRSSGDYIFENGFNILFSE